jgi:hypothetical protein
MIAKVSLLVVAAKKVHLDEFRRVATEFLLLKALETQALT